MRKILTAAFCCFVCVLSVGCSRNNDPIAGEAKKANATTASSLPSVTPRPTPQPSEKLSNADFLTAPNSWWIEPEKIPLYAQYRWPALGQRQEHVQDQHFKFEEICGSKRPSNQEFGEVYDRIASVQAQVHGNSGDWSVHEQIFHLPGDTWRMTQTTGFLYDALVGELRDCSATKTGAKILSITQVGPGEVATLSIPAENDSTVTLHEYLIAPGGTGSVVELSLWVEGNPKTPWPDPPNQEVLDAMTAGLCRKNNC